MRFPGAMRPKINIAHPPGDAYFGFNEHSPSEEGNGEIGKISAIAATYQSDAVYRAQRGEATAAATLGEGLLKNGDEFVLTGWGDLATMQGKGCRKEGSSRPRWLPED